MEFLEPLSDFFSAIENDPRISITHIRIYAALLQYWKEHGFENPMQVFSYISVMSRLLNETREVKFIFIQ